MIILTQDDIKNFKQIVQNSYSYHKNFNPSNSNTGNRGWKYTHILKKGGNLIKCEKNNLRANKNINKIANNILMKETGKNIEYKYVNSIETLVKIMKKLIAAKNQGHNNVDNEILSIANVLRNNNIIH